MTHLKGAERLQAARDLQARYYAGDSIRGLATATGRSYGYVHGLLVLVGTTFRPRGFQKGAVR